jgi:hypothetical protein
VGKGKGARLDVECADFALCSDVLDLGWTAVTPCRGCVIADVAVASDRAATDAPTIASPALIVTGDELEQLLSQARQPRTLGPTS